MIRKRNAEGIVHTETSVTILGIESIKDVARIAFIEFIEFIEYQGERRGASGAS